MSRRSTNPAAEQQAREADEALQDRGEPAPRQVQRLAQGFVHTTRPDDGLPVVFTPGEAIPDWAPAVCKCQRCKEA